MRFINIDDSARMTRDEKNEQINHIGMHTAHEFQNSRIAFFFFFFDAIATKSTRDNWDCNHWNLIYKTLATLADTIEVHSIAMRCAKKRIILCLYETSEMNALKWRPRPRDFFFLIPFCRIFFSHEFVSLISCRSSHFFFVNKNQLLNSRPLLLFFLLWNEFPFCGENSTHFARIHCAKVLHSIAISYEIQFMASST